MGLYSDSCVSSVGGVLHPVLGEHDDLAGHKQRDGVLTQTPSPAHLLLDQLLLDPVLLLEATSQGPRQAGPHVGPHLHLQHIQSRI